MTLKSNQFVVDMFSYIVEDCKLQVKKEWLDFADEGLNEIRPSENVFTPEIGRAIRTFAEEKKKGKEFMENFLALSFDKETPVLVTQEELKVLLRKKILKMAEKCIAVRDDCYEFFDFCGHAQNVFLSVHYSGKVQFLPVVMSSVAEVLRYMMWNFMSQHEDYNEYAGLVNEHYKTYGKIISHP